MDPRPLLGPKLAEDSKEPGPQPRGTPNHLHRGDEEGRNGILLGSNDIRVRLCCALQLCPPEPSTDMKLRQNLWTISDLPKASSFFSWDKTPLETKG